MSNRSERKRRWDRDNMFRSTRGRGKTLTPDVIKLMRDMRREGKTVKEIHLAVNVNYHTASKYTKDVK